MESLFNEPWNLETDDLIRAVVTAENKRGWGEVSEPNETGLRMD